MMIFSAIWMISGEAPTLAPGMMPPSSVMAEASTIATSWECQSHIGYLRGLSLAPYQFVVRFVLGVEAVH
jgi:hypothetical protein